MKVRRFLKISLLLICICSRMESLWAYTVPTSGRTTITVKSCKGIVTDDGGTSQYSNNVNGALTIYPGTNGAKVKLTFSSFSTEANNDVLYIYDGKYTSSPLIASYSGGSLPSVVTATNSTGTLTLKFVTNNTTVGSGFQASISCVESVSYTDLTIDSLKLFSNIFAPGEDNHASIYLKSSGTNDVLSDVSVGCFLSTDSVFDSGDIFLSTKSIGSVYSGYSYLMSLNFTLPEDLDFGEYFIVFVVDYKDLIVEFNEGNNFIHRSLEVRGAFKDVTVSSAILSSNSVSRGGDITAYSVMKNIGNATIGYTYVGYYLSNDEIYDEGDLYLDLSYSSYLSPGISSTIVEEINVPLSIEVGNYYVLVLVDYYGFHDEMNEKNNVVAIPIKVENPKNDILIFDPLLDAKEVLVGEQILVNANLFNNGFDTLGSDWRLGYYLSRDSIWDASDSLIAIDDGSNLEPGNYSFKSAYLTIPWVTLSGEYYIIFKADSDEDIVEFDEKNNEVYLPISVRSREGA